MFNLLIAVLILHSVALDIPVPTFPPIPSPTPVGTWAPDPLATPILLTGKVFDILSTVEYGLRTLPDDVRNPGLPIVPSPNGVVLFGYAKWLMSPFSSQEIFGPFADFAPRLGTIVAINVAMIAITSIIYLASFVLKFVSWLVVHIKMLLPF